MSLAFLSRPIGGSKKDADPSSNGPEPSRRTKVGPIRGTSGNVTVGDSPRVDLMPPEIRVKRSQLKTRRQLRLGLFGVFVVVAVACAATWTWSSLAQSSLAAAQAQQQLLVAQQSKFSDVTTVKDSIVLIKAGQIVGDSSEIDWEGYLTKLQATLPSGVVITTVTIDSESPIKAFAESSTPLEGDRIASLQFTASSAALPSIPVWLDGLRTLPGFVDATPGSVSLDTAGGGYTAQVTMHINSKALANRFIPKKDGSSTTDSSGDTGSSSTDGGN